MVTLIGMPEKVADPDKVTRLLLGILKSPIRMSGLGFAARLFK